MSKYQRYVNKLYFAGKHEYWKLVDFYVEEIEESVKDLAKKKVLVGLTNVSPLMASLLIPAIDELETAIQRGDIEIFHKEYNNLITACNVCHQGVGHDQIVITQPRTPVYDNQIYEVVPVGYKPVASVGSNVTQ